MHTCQRTLRSLKIFLFIFVRNIDPSPGTELDNLQL